MKYKNPRRFKIYKETEDQTIARAKDYIERFGLWSYPSEIIDKLLIDKGIKVELTCLSG